MAIQENDESESIGVWEQMTCLETEIPLVQMGEKTPNGDGQETCVQKGHLGGSMASEIKREIGK